MITMTRKWSYGFKVGRWEIQVYERGLKYLSSSGYELIGKYDISLTDRTDKKTIDYRFAIDISTHCDVLRRLTSIIHLQRAL